jgi:hypothetical protein
MIQKEGEWTVAVVFKYRYGYKCIYLEIEFVFVLCQNIIFVVVFVYFIVMGFRY